MNQYRIRLSENGTEWIKNGDAFSWEINYKIK